MSKWLLATIFWLLVGVSGAFAQNVTCATRPNGDDTNACASTAFVQNTVATIGGSLVVGTTPITGGTNTLCLYDNAGVLGVQACGGGSSGLTIGTTTISGGTSTYCLYNNGGILANQVCSSGGISNTFKQCWNAGGTGGCGTFTAGTTTSLTLANPPATVAGLLVFFDPAWQNTGNYTLSGSTLTFGSAIPVGVTEVEVVSGVIASSVPATSVGFTQLGTGAVGTTLGARAQESWLYVQDFGADCTGATDSTTALTNAVAAAIAQGRPLQLCQGTIKVSESTGIPITGNLIVEGAGGQQSTIENTNTNGVVFSASLGSGGVYQFRHIGYTVAGTPTGGEFLSDNAATTENSGAKFIDFFCTNAFNCLDLEKSSHWTIDQTHFIDGIVNNAMVVQNTINQDSGDSVISNSEFFLFTAGGSCSGSTANGIFQEGSGGLKVTGTKFNCVKSAYWLDVGVSVSSSISVFTGDSLENCNNDCVILQPQSGGTWGFVVFTGDEIRPVTSGSIGIVVGGSSASWLNGLTVSGNSGAVNNAQFLNITFGTDVALTGNSVGSDGGTATLAAWGTVSHCQSVGNATALTSTGTCTP